MDIGQLPPQPLPYWTPPEFRQGTIVIRDSRRQLVAKLVVSLLCIPGSLALAKFARSAHLSFPFTAAITVVLGTGGVVGAILNFWQLTNRRPRMLIDGTGITDNFTNFGLILWQQIISAKIITDLRRPYLCLTVTEPESIRSRRGRIFAIYSAGLNGMGLSDVAIPLDGVSTPSADLLMLVRQHLRREN